MRALLRVVILFFVLLIGVEKTTRSALSPISNFSKKIKRRTSPKIRAFKRVYRMKKYAKIKSFSFGIVFSLLFILLPILFMLFLQDLPNPRQLSAKDAPQTTRILDRNGIVLGEIYGNFNRTIIPLSDVPLHLQQATLAIEDKNFYSHPGFDIPSIIRAFRKNLSGKAVQGGSTITQQLIKSSLLTPEQSISRKVKEVVLAFWAERIYTKKQILEMYFNQVPYGGMSWGIEAASEAYFNKPVKKISLAQSAFLAGLTSAPSIYSPYGMHPGLWKKRQKEVLDHMVALKYITKKQEDVALKEKLTFQHQQLASHAPHFVNYITDMLIQKYGITMVEKGGLQVKTTLDLSTQEMAEKIVADEVKKAAPLHLSNGAVVVTDPRSGDILAMVGGHDFNDPDSGNVNLATSLRQPGSSIKTLTYSAALEHGFTAATILDDSPISYPSDNGSYSPVNYDGQFHGRVPLRIALANSFNITAVKTLDQIGVPALVDLAKAMGITTWGDATDYGLSLTLGAAEVKMVDMAEAYGALANGGIRQEVNPILKVSDAKGTVFEEKTPGKGTRVLKKSTAFIMSDILADNPARSMEFGPNSPLMIKNHYVSVKTGTSDEKRDNWTDGYTNNYVVITWVGNNNNEPMDQSLASGITGAAPIWHRIMENLLTKYPETRPTPPHDVVQSNCFGKTEYFVKGTENTADCIPLSTYSSR
jgi:1A family penicillin-binding protein